MGKQKTASKSALTVDMDEETATGDNIKKCKKKKKMSERREAADNVQPPVSDANIGESCSTKRKKHKKKTQELCHLSSDDVHSNDDMKNTTKKKRKKKIEEIENGSSYEKNECNTSSVEEGVELSSGNGPSTSDDTGTENSTSQKVKKCKKKKKKKSEEIENGLSQETTECNTSTVEEGVDLLCSNGPSACDGSSEKLNKCKKKKKSQERTEDDTGVCDKKKKKKKLEAQIQEPSDVVQSEEENIRKKKNKKGKKKTKVNGNSETHHTDNSDLKEESIHNGAMEDSNDDSIDQAHVKKTKKRKKHGKKRELEECAVEEKDKNLSSALCVASQEVEPRKKKKKDAVSPALGQWGTAEFGDDEKRQKFLRLMGGFKKQGSEGGKKSGLFGSLQSATGGHALDGGRQDAVNSALQRQYDAAQSLRSGQRRGGGLGFTPPNTFHIDTHQSNSTKFD